MAIIPAYTINGFTRPELIVDGFGNIVLDDTASAFAQAYGIKALYLGCPPGTPYPPVLPSLLFPTDANDAANTVAEGAAVNTTVGITAHSTSILGFPVTYSLTGDSSGGGFKINPTTGVVSVADPSKINFESNSDHSYSITVRANDGILTTFRTFTIGVSDVAPSAPSDANAGANTVAEGAANGTAVGVTVSATDVNGGTVTYSLTNDANGAFAINATTGVITVKDSTKIDFESAPGHAYTVTARASDGTLFSSTQTFTINVTDVAPSAPTDSNGAANSVAEGATNGSLVGLTASSVDPNGPATTYSLTDNAGGRFAINSSTGVVTVANGAAIDFETAPGHAYSIAVQATSGATSTTQTFSIGVTDVGPSTPTDANGAANTVFERAANGTAVGITAASTDPGGTPPVTYSLTDNAGGRFAIDPNTGIVTVANGAAIDFETAPGHAYGITVQTQAGALTSTKNFSIEVANVNEAPAGADKAVSTAEDTNFVFSVADFGFTDPGDSSAPNSLLAVFINTVPLAGAGTLTNNGNPVIPGDSISAADIAAGHLVFTPALDANGSPLATFGFQVRDNGGTANGGVDFDLSPNTITINVTPVNDAPTAPSLTKSLIIDEDAAATPLFGAPLSSVADVDSTNVTATLTLVNQAAGVLTGGGFTATGNPGEYSFTGTPVNVTAALNGVQFDSADDFNGSTSVNVVISDGANGPQGANPTGTVSITVNAVNDAPTATNLLQFLTIDEDAAPTTLFTTAPVVSDIDSANVTAKLVLSPTSGVLTGGGFALTGIPGEYAFSGTAAEVTAALAAVKFDSADNFNAATFVNVFISDGLNGPQGGNPVGSVQITVNAVNDAPTATGLTQSLSIGEDAAATTLFTIAPVVSDIDSATLTATLTLVNSAAGVLTGGGFAAGVTPGEYVFSGTQAQVNAALAAVQFDSADDFNGVTTVNVTIDDGLDGPQGDNPTGIGTVTINAVNDAPTATNLMQSLMINEDAAATTLFTLPPVVSDVDSTNVTATLTLVNAAAGVLAGGGFAATGNTGEYVFSGTQAQVNAALAAVQFDSAGDFNGVTNVNVLISDGANGPQGTNPTGTVSIIVNAVNDAPTATNLSQSLVINEDDAATTLFTAAPVVADIDSPSVTATLTLDAAAGTLNNAGAGVLAGGVLTYTIAGTAAQVNAALAAVTYDSAQDFFGTSSVGVTISDGAGGPQGLPEPTGTVGITVNPVNDAPTVAATANNPTYVPGADLFSGVTASTVESGQVISQVVLKVSNVLGNDESISIDGHTVALLDGTVSVAPTATLGVSYSVVVSNNTATITITSPGLTGAQAGTLIDGLSYTNTTVGPNELPRVVTIVSLTDDGGTALGGVATGTPGIASTVNFNTPPIAHDDAASVIEAGGLNNTSAGTNASGNVITATGPGDVADTDADAGDTLTVVAARPGQEGTPTGPGTVNTAFNGLHGSLLINTDGSYTYTVDQTDAAVQALRLSTDTLTDTFNYTIQDSAGAQDFATLTFTIHGANDNPTAVADTPIAVEAGGAGNGTLGTNPGGNVLTNDTDVDGVANGETRTVQGVAAGTQAGPLTLNVGSGVASANGYGTLTIGSDGTYSYVVDNSNAAVQALRTSGQTLTDTFSYTMHDQAGVTSTTQVTVTIQGANDNPTAVNDIASATEAGGVNNGIAGNDPSGNLLTNDTDVDGNGETKTVQGVEFGNHPGNIVLAGVGNPIQGTYGTLTVQANGDYTYQVDQTLANLLLPTDQPTEIFTYTMRDAAGVTSTAILTVTVNGANDLPLAVADAGIITEDAVPTLFPVVVNNDVRDLDAGALNSIAINGTVTASSGGDPLITDGDATAVVSGNQIQVTLGADFQTLAQGETATVTVPYSLTGNAGETSSSTLTVTVTGVNDGVVAIDDVGGSITEDAGLTTYNVRANDTLDVDHTALNNVTIDSVSATDAGGDGITGNDVTASVTAGNDIQFTLGSDFQKLGAGESSTITIGYTLHGDQPGDTDSGTLTYTVTGVNDAPTAANFTFNTANGSAAIGNTALVVNDGTDAAPDPTGPQKTVSGDLLAGASDVDTASTLWSISAVGGNVNAATTSVTNASGTIVFERDGDFTYTPAAGFTGNASFSYQVNDNDPSGNAAGTGTINIEVAAPKVWYVDAANGSDTTGDGTSDNPFQTLTALNGVNGNGDVDGANDTIFLYNGTYTGGIALESGQKLISQSQGLTVNGTLLEAATGGNAVINGTVTLADGNTVDGIDFGTVSGGFALQNTAGSSVGTATVSHSSINNTQGGAINIADGGTLAMNFTSVSSGSGANGIALSNTTGTFSAAAGTLANATGADVSITGNNSGDDLNFTYNGAINDSTGTTVSISGQNGGTKDFNGAITGGGISLATNTGATISFDGGMTLSTGASNAFSATGGGTVTVTGTNHLTTTTGTALNISNTTIGSADVTFQDISSNGAANGIVLNTTGSSGGLIVTGDSGSAVNNSGGIIQNTTGAGISLTNTRDVSLDQMNIQNTADDGIHGTTVTNFGFTNSTMTGAGNGANEFGIFITDLFGTGTINNSSITNSQTNNLRIVNSNSTAGTLNIANSTFTTTDAANGGDAVSVQTDNTGNLTVNLTDNNDLNNSQGDGIQASANNTSTLRITADGSNSNYNGNLGSAINIAAANGAHIFALIKDFGNRGADANPANNTGGLSTGSGVDADSSGVADNGLNVINIQNFDTSVIDATVQNSVINGLNNNASGIRVIEEGNATINVDINNVFINGMVANGIQMQARAGTGAINATVHDTDVRLTNPLSLDAMSFESGSSAGGDTNTLRLDLFNNDATATPAGQSGYQLRVRAGTTFQLEDFIGNGNNAADVTAWVNNAPKSNIGTVNGLLTGGAYSTIADVPMPSLPMLAAAGGVQSASNTPGVTSLSQAQLDSVVAAAITQWAHAGASASQLAALAAVTFSVADLAGNIAGEQSPGHIVIDSDAAGHGWFVDATPFDNSDFTHAANAAGTDLFTDPTSAAAGHLDLLTTVVHELGHELGMPDLTAAADAHDLMFIDLVDGERRLPDAGDLPLVNTGAANAPVVAGTPGNDTIDAGHGGKILVGGAGADNFVFAHLPDAATPPTHVADYSFIQGDSFDFSALTSAFHGLAVDEAFVVRAVEGASGTFATLQVNTTPFAKNASWVDVAQLDGIHAGDDVSVLIDSHAAVHVAHLHAGLLV